MPAATAKGSSRLDAASAESLARIALTCLIEYHEYLMVTWVGVPPTQAGVNGPGLRLSMVRAWTASARVSRISGLEIDGILTVRMEDGESCRW